MLTVDSLICYRSDVPLFQSVSFAIHSGQILRIDGPNGVGKTTCLRALVGLYSDYTGSIVLTQNAKAEKSDLLFISDKISINLQLTVLENIQNVLGLWYQINLSDIVSLAERIGLLGELDVLAGRLSYGQRRRIALVRAVLSNALLWILDEPLIGLDEQWVRWLLELINQHVDQGGAAIVVSHQICHSMQNWPSITLRLW